MWETSGIVIFTSNSTIERHWRGLWLFNIVHGLVRFLSLYVNRLSLRLLHVSTEMTPGPQFGFVILCQHPTGLHTGGFTFLETTIVGSYKKTVQLYLKSAELTSFSCVFVNLAFQVIGTFQYGSVTVHSPPEIVIIPLFHRVSLPDRQAKLKSTDM